MTRALTALTVATLAWVMLRFAFPPDLVRALNVPVSILAAALVAVRVNDRWRYLTFGRRLTFVGTTAVLAVAAFGSAEAYVQGAPTGERVPLFTVACGLILAGLWLSRHEPRSTYP